MVTGLRTERVQAVLERARREVDEGILPSCQVAVARSGELVAFETYGDAGPTTRYAAFSCTKAIVAGAAWVLMGEGRLDVSTPVVEYVPEFATNGKHAVTVEHLLVHTAGFPLAALGPPDWSTSEGRTAAFRRWELSSEPGTAYEYHATSSYWVLAEIIERVSGVDFRDFVEERVTRPAGLPRRVLGVPPDDQEGVAVLEVRGELATPDELEAAIGMRDLPVGEATHDALLSFNLPEIRAAGVPGAGAVMRADELALFYQALLHNPGRMWHTEVLADATGRVRNRLGDRLFGMPANRTLGLVQAGDDGLAFLRGFGYTASPRTFGHGGAGGQVAWADPASGLSLAFLTNGIDAHVIRAARRGIEISSLAGECASPA